MTQHHITGLSEVARLCDVSLSTVNRKVPKLRDYGAQKDAEGVWHVPVTAIEAVGLKLRADTSPDMPQHATVTQGETSPDTSELRTLRTENSDLRASLSAAEARADMWQAIAAERLQNLDDLRRSQRLLEAAHIEPETTPAPAREPVAETTPEPATDVPQINLFGRLRRMRGGHG